MIDLKADEDAIVKQIKDNVDGYAVKPFPDVPPFDYNVQDSRGEIMVSFGGASVPEDSPELIKESQTRTYRWIVAVYSKNRRTHQGAYEILEKVDDALVGFQLRYHFMRYVDTQFVGYNTEKQVWVYRSTYEIIDQSIKGE
jgi:hypothetical protein